MALSTAYPTYYDGLGYGWGKVLFTTGLVFLLSCRPPEPLPSPKCAVGQPSALELTALVHVLENPSSFEGKTVKIEGYTFFDEPLFLAHHKSQVELLQWCHHPLNEEKLGDVIKRNSSHNCTDTLWLRLMDEMIMVTSFSFRETKQVANCKDKYVAIVGVFHEKREGRPSLEDVSFIGER